MTRAEPQTGFCRERGQESARASIDAVKRRDAAKTESLCGGDAADVRQILAGVQADPESLSVSRHQVPVLRPLLGLVMSVQPQENGERICWSLSRASMLFYLGARLGGMWKFEMCRRRLVPSPPDDREKAWHC